MRIVGGRYKGHRLFAPDGPDTRPTADAHRETVFNVLMNGLGLAPTRVLDLFAGTGALSLEALSMGAEKAVLVEKSRPALKAIQRNFEKVGVSPSDWTVVTEPDLRKWPDALGEIGRGFGPFDLVFCDPPYSKGLAERALLSLAPKGADLFVPGCALVCEVASRDPVPALGEDWELAKDRSRGATRLLFYLRRA